MKLSTFWALACLSLNTASAAGILVDTFSDYDAWFAAVGGADNEGFPSGYGPGNPSFVSSVVSATGSVVVVGEWRDTLMAPQTTAFSYLPGTFTAAFYQLDLSPNDYGSGVVVSVIFGGGSEVLNTHQLTFDIIKFGFTSNTPLNSIVFGTQQILFEQETFHITKLAFAKGEVASGVPEPNTLGTLAFGLAAMGLTWRYRKR